jgi:hypothetical protein
VTTLAGKDSFSGTTETILGGEMRLFAAGYSATAGTVTSLKARVNGGSGVSAFRMALYDAAGNKIVESASTSVALSGSAETLSASVNQAISAGTTYVAFVCNGTSINIDTAGATFANAGQSITYPNLPATISVPPSADFALKEMAVWADGVIPTVEQEGYRWRADDGDEDAATWLASQDSNITRATALNTRLRLLLNATNDPASTAYRLEYKLSTDSTYQKVETAGGGAIAYGALGTLTTTGTTAPNIAYPSGISEGDLLIMVLGNRPNASTFSTPSGWTAPSGNTATGGAGSEGAGTGVVRATVFTRVATGTESGSFALSLSSGTSVVGGIFRVGRTTGKNWSVALASGSDSSAGTSYSAAMGSDPGVTSGDLVFVASVTSEDTPTFASEALSQTGVTYGTMTERIDQAVTTGNDLHLVLSEHAITSGTSSAAATYTMTASGTNAANTAGVSIMIRLRQVDQPIQLSASGNITASGENTTVQLTAPSGKSTSDFVAGRIQDDENPADAINITADDYTEVEWCMQATANAANDDVYQFRVTANGVALNTYSVTPQWTIGSGGGDQDADFSIAIGAGATFAAIATTFGALAAGASAAAAKTGLAATVASISSGTSASESHASSKGASGAMSSAIGAGATHAAQAAAVATLQDGISAGSVLGAQAAAIASIASGIGAADTGDRALTAATLISAGASADAAVAALSAAVAALTAGLAAGEVWASHAAAAAQLAAAGQFGAEFSAETEAILSGETQAASSFLASADALGIMVAGATLAESVAATAAAIGVFTSGASLAATFDALTVESFSIEAAASAGHVFAALAAALGSLTAAVSADSIVSARAVTQGALAAGATFGAAFLGEGGLTSILPPAKATLVVAPRVRSLMVTPRTRTQH